MCPSIIFTKTHSAVFTFKMGSSSPFSRPSPLSTLIWCIPGILFTKPNPSSGHHTLKCRWNLSVEVQTNYTYWTPNQNHDLPCCKLKVDEANVMIMITALALLHFTLIKSRRSKRQLLSFSQRSSALVSFWMPNCFALITNSIRDLKLG